MPRFDVVGVGTAACDYLVTLPRFPAPDEKSRAEELTIDGGGTIGTALVTIARLGLRSAWLGSVGNDDFGKIVLEGLEREGVDTSFARVVPGARSPFAFCISSPPTRNVFSVAATTPPLALGPGELDALLDTRAIHLDGSDDVCLELAREARKRGVDVSVDLHRMQPRAADLLASADVAVVAESYARAAWPGVDPIRAVATLHQPGMRLAAITLGPRGVVASEGGVPYLVPAESVEVVDSTGAGDAFHGALLVGLLAGHTIAHSLRFAAHVAALCCSAMGGRAGVPHRDELGDWL